MVLEELRARIDRLLAERGADTRAYASGLYQAMVETKAAVATIREALERTRRELEVEQQRLADAERRGRLAHEIGDQETADLADHWATKHRELTTVLERKLAVQEDELRLAERQLDEYGEAYRQARQGMPPSAAPVTPIPDTPELLRMERELDRQTREALVKEQLAHLKKKLGRQD
jgi:hypothetical protein